MEDSEGCDEGNWELRGRDVGRDIDKEDGSCNVDCELGGRDVGCDVGAELKGWELG